MQDDDSQVNRIAAAFVAARRSGLPLASFPGAIPPDLAAAYRIQAVAIANSGEPVGGWKVGRIFPPASDTFGAERLAGPIFSGSIVRDDGVLTPRGRVFDGGFGAAEAEFVLRIGTAPPVGQRRFSLDEAAALVDCAHVGIEIASSPLAGVNDLGPPVIVTDFGNNNGLVIGEAIDDWRATDYPEWTVVTLIDNEEAGRGHGAAMPDGPLGAVRFLLELAAERGFALQAGTWVSSGAVTGVHRVRPGQNVEARFGSAAVVRCHIEAMPRTDGRKAT